METDVPVPATSCENHLTLSDDGLCPVTVVGSEVDIVNSDVNSDAHVDGLTADREETTVVVHSAGMQTLELSLIHI